MEYDYNAFYVKSLEAGATPDQFGNIVHTPASMSTLQTQEQLRHLNQRFAQELENKPLGFWQSLFG